MKITILHEIFHDDFLDAVKESRDAAISMGEIVTGSGISLRSFSDTDVRPNPHNKNLLDAVREADCLLIEGPCTLTDTGKDAMETAKQAGVFSLIYGRAAKQPMTNLEQVT